MACKNKKNHKGFAKENIFRGYYLQTVIKNEKKVNSRCKLEELCYNETCSAGLCDQYINSVYCEAYY